MNKTRVKLNYESAYLNVSNTISVECENNKIYEVLDDTQLLLICEPKNKFVRFLNDIEMNLLWEALDLPF